MAGNQSRPPGCRWVAPRRQRAAWPGNQPGPRHALPPGSHSTATRATRRPWTGS